MLFQCVCEDGMNTVANVGITSALDMVQNIQIKIQNSRQFHMFLISCCRTNSFGYFITQLSLYDLCNYRSFIRIPE
jgi:hypothetical protein